MHVLARLGRTITQAEWVKELKRVSNSWLKERGRDFRDFEWQGGYAAFSVSQSNLEQVKQYIATQEEHHRKMNFKMNCGRCYASTRWNGMRNTFGIEFATTALRLNPFLNDYPR